MLQLDSAFPTCLDETTNNYRVAPINSRVSPWLASLIYPLGCQFVLPSFFNKIAVTGQEHLPTVGPTILAPTHRSRWDALLVPAIARRSVADRYPRFMVKADEMEGLQGWFIRRLGGFPIDTARPSISALRHGVELLQAGEILVIFPEGGIFQDGYLHPLKPGLARLALSAESSQPGLGIKIVPIGIRYSQAFPEWGCDVSLQFGAPLQVADYNNGPPKQQAKQLTTDVEMALKTLSGNCAIASI